jgi:hypothetical protein
VNQRFTILSPCPKKWAQLQGEGRSRYCDVCRTPVHAIAEYAPEEWNQLWRESSGMVCGFLACETAIATRSRRAVLIGALLTAVAPLWAEIGRVRIRVVDMTGAVVPHANVSLLATDDRPIRTATADERGEVVWTDLPLGDSHLLVNAPGFNSRRLTVTVRDAIEKRVEAPLAIGTIGETVSIDLDQILAHGPGLLLEPGQMPYSQRLDSPPESAPRSPQAKPSKHRWWQIFR